MSHPERGASVLTAILGFAVFATVAYGVYAIIPENSASQTAATLAAVSADTASKADLQGPERCVSPLKERQEAGGESSVSDASVQNICVRGCLYRVTVVNGNTKIVASDLAAHANGQVSQSYIDNNKCIVQQCDAAGKCIDVTAASISGGSLDAFLTSHIAISAAPQIMENPDLQQVLALAKTDPAAAQKALSSLSPQLQQAYQAVQADAVKQNNAEIQSNIDTIREIGGTASGEAQNLQLEIDRLRNENRNLAQVNPEIVTSQASLAANTAGRSPGAAVSPGDGIEYASHQSSFGQPQSSGSGQAGLPLPLNSEEARRFAAYDPDTATPAQTAEHAALQARVEAVARQDRIVTENRMQQVLPKPPVDFPTSDRDWTGTSAQTSDAAAAIGGNKFGGNTFGGRLFGGNLFGGNKFGASADAIPEGSNTPSAEFSQGDFALAPSDNGNVPPQVSPAPPSPQADNADLERQQFADANAAPQGAEPTPITKLEQSKLEEENAAPQNVQSPYGNNKFGGNTFGGFTFGGAKFGASARTNESGTPQISGNEIDQAKFSEANAAPQGSASPYGNRTFGGNIFGGNVFGGNLFGGNRFGASAADGKEEMDAPLQTTGPQLEREVTPASPVVPSPSVSPEMRTNDLEMAKFNEANAEPQQSPPAQPGDLDRAKFEEANAAPQGEAPREATSPPQQAPRPDGTAPSTIEESDGFCFATAGNASQRLYLVNRGYQCDATGLGSYSCTMQKGAAGCTPPFNPTPAPAATPRQTTTSAPANQQTPPPQPGTSPQQAPVVPQVAPPSGRPCLTTGCGPGDVVPAGGGFCVVSQVPLIVVPVAAGSPFPANCYNTVPPGATTPPVQTLNQNMPLYDTQGNPCRDANHPNYPFANQIECKTVKPAPLPWQRPVAPPTPSSTTQNPVYQPGWQSPTPAAIQQTGGQCYATANNVDQRVYLSLRSYGCFGTTYPMACSKTDSGGANGCL